MPIFKDRSKTCYWCGKQATSREHVPPSNIFPKGYRNELLTVGACSDHNESFSKLDERLRYHMLLLGDEEIARNHFETKAYRGLKREGKTGLLEDLTAKSFERGGGLFWQKDDSDLFNLYFEKIIRGLLFYHYGIRIEGSISFFSNKMQLLSLSANAHFYFYLLEEDYKDQWIDGSSFNKDVFEYKYYYSEEEKRFFTIMTFYKVHEIIGVTLPPGKVIDDYSPGFEEYSERSNK